MRLLTTLASCTPLVLPIAGQQIYDIVCSVFARILLWTDYSAYSGQPLGIEPSYSLMIIWDLTLSISSHLVPLVRQTLSSMMVPNTKDCTVLVEVWVCGGVFSHPVRVANNTVDSWLLRVTLEQSEGKNISNVKDRSCVQFIHRARVLERIIPYYRNCLIVSAQLLGFSIDTYCLSQHQRRMATAVLVFPTCVCHSGLLISLRVVSHYDVLAYTYVPFTESLGSLYLWWYQRWHIVEQFQYQ